MSIFKKISNNIESFKINTVILLTFENDYVQAAIIKANQDQLWKGIGADGKVIRTFAAFYGNVYATTTINIKQAKGQDTEHVTLYDEGDFWRTMAVELKKNSVTLIADFTKEGGSISDNLNTDVVLGLIPESINRVNEDSVFSEFYKQLKKAIIEDVQLR